MPLRELMRSVKVRQEFSDVLNRVAYGNERCVVTKHGKPMAAIIPIEDLELLEALEDKVDLQEALAALGDQPWRDHEEAH